MYSKSQLFSIFLQFKKMAKLQLSVKLKMFQSNNAKEYASFSNYLKSKDILHRFSYPYMH